MTVIKITRKTDDAGTASHVSEKLKHKRNDTHFALYKLTAYIPGQA